MAGGYQGRKISLDFHKADIHNVFRVISDVCEKNLVIGSRVKGTVTIKLIDVPWDQALDVILQNNKLDKLEVGNVIRIAPRKEIEAELKNKEAKILAARKAKEILAPLATEVLFVNYANADDIVSQVESILTPDRGKVSTDERTNALIVRDVETTIERVRKFIIKLDQPTPQVLIEARVVQFNPSYTKDIGIRWNAEYRTQSLGKGDSTYRPPAEGNIHTPNLLGYNYDAAAGAGALASGALGQMAFGFISNSLSLDIELNALEKEDKVTIISRPRIMTLDNKEAVIEQGVDLPYLKLSEQGVTSTEFKKATLELKVRPHITPDGSVIMKISVKKDQKSSQTGAGGEPGIDTKKAETEVLVRDGQTVVIGGIIEENEVEIEEWVPFFSKIPLFGRLFRKSFIEKVKSDLTIFITPRIINNKSKIATND